MNEFEIIEHYFKQAYPTSQDGLTLGIGDDAAIIDVPEDCELVVSMDTLVGGVHFPVETSPEDIGFKSLAVSLSDLAAMGAEPRWLMLSLTIPEFEASWMEGFASGFNQLAKEHSAILIGGDLSRGSLSITVQIQGTVPKSVLPKGAAIQRDGAKQGDMIFVTGELGAAAYALELTLAKKTPKQSDLLRLKRPQARIETGIALRGIATSCIDISDGLLADIGHILKASKVGAEVKLSDIPYSDSLQKLDKDIAIELALTGGDDYELCFTLPDGTPATVLNELKSICPIHCIGSINDQESKLNLVDDNGEPFEITTRGYRHFS